MAMEPSAIECERETHYVLVVHGTFNKPEAGKVKWYQPGEGNPNNFCNQLNELLARTNLGPAVWRSYDIGTAFSWSGKNKHEARIEAADGLCNQIIELTRRDQSARIHLVAHSHGGNVALKAIELYHEYLSGLATCLFKSLERQVENGVDDPIRAALDQIRHYRGIDPSMPSPRAWEGLLREPLDGLRSGRADWSLRYLFFGSFMGLGEPLVAERAFLRDWCTSDRTNRLGSVVFLGTPFLRKQWLVSRQAMLRVLARFLGNLLILPYYGICLYVVVLLYGFLLGLTPWLPILSWRPTQWPGWVLILWILITLSMSVPIIVVYSIEPYIYNSNLYFDFFKFRKLLGGGDRLSRPAVGGKGMQGRSDDRRIPALVITARYLDEALLGLSSEAFVHAILSPLIDGMLYPVSELSILRLWRQELRRRSMSSQALAAPMKRAVVGLKTASGELGSAGDTHLDRLPSQPNAQQPCSGQTGQSDDAPHVHQPHEIEVRRWATPASWQGSEPVGVNPYSVVFIYKGIDAAIRLIGIVTYALFWPVWATIRAFLVKPFLMDFAMKLVYGIVFGLPTRELRRPHQHPRPAGSASGVPRDIRGRDRDGLAPRGGAIPC